MTKALAEIVAAAYDASDKTRGQIAKEAGMSVITAKRIAGRDGGSRAASPPNIEQIAALARAFGASPALWIDAAERRVQASNE